MKLIIVESPAKARTIERFLGSDYRVAASYGHIRDLPGSAAEIPERLRKEPWARMGVDPDDDYRPVYVVQPESRKRVQELKRLLKGADEVLLATDEDREGEAISWHLLEVLDPAIPVRRITFHEITRDAIAEALRNPRQVDRQLVRAQESRRILDRLYGYTLSPVLWKKVRTKLSAGRVQSVAVRLIVEREEERQAFRTAEYWDVEAELEGAGLRFGARLVEVAGRRLAGGRDFDPASGRLREGVEALVLDGEAAARVAAAAPAALPWRVGRVERRQTRQRPQPPLITSTLQQLASNALGFSPQRTMRIAQRLYEGVNLEGGREGLITYMRTDSLTLSEKALRETAELVRERYGERYSEGPRRYRTTAKSAQEAHEAIRPTDVHRTPEQAARHLQKEELDLYRLIWSRTVASQMTDALLDRTTADLACRLGEEDHVFRATGSVVRFDGFLRVHGGGQKDALLPELTEGQALGAPGGDEAVAVRGAGARRHETTPPARYTEASLIRKLEEEGIGRPSTYAPIISTIQDRGYVEKKSGSLIPTFIGMAVVRLLREHFPRYVDLHFTASMEEDLDEIAEGRIDATEFLDRFYRGRGQPDGGLLGRIERELPRIDFPAIPVGADPGTGEPITARIGRSYVYIQAGDGERRATLPVDLFIDELTPQRAHELLEAGARADEPLGRDPESGEAVYVRVGPYGPYLQLGEGGDGQKPKRVSLPRGRKPSEVTLEAALRLLSLPRRVGTDPETGQPVTAGLGRYGPYVESGRVYAKADDVDQLFTISLEEALERIRAKNRRTILKELGPHPQSDRPLQLLKGRYGPYLSDGQVNARIPRGEDPQAITPERAVELLAAAAERKPARKATGKSGKKAAKKTTRKTTKGTTKKTAKKTTKRTTKKAGKKTATRKAAKKAAGKTAKKATGKTAEKAAKKPAGRAGGTAAGES